MNEEASGRPIEILLVEDNPGDVRLMEEALKEVALSSNLRVVGDGEEVLEVLRGEGKYAPSLRPDWIESWKTSRWWCSRGRRPNGT